MSNLFLVILFVLPWSSFLFRKCDIWHGHGMWFQVGLLGLFAYSFIEKPKLNKVKNVPLGLLTFWLGITTSFYWLQTLEVTQKYAIITFLPFFNFLCFLGFYKLSIEYLDKKSIEKIFRWLPYSVFLVLLYCLLQKVNLDQFYIKISNPKGLIGDDILVGTIGNSSHLAGWLGISQVLFFKKGWFNYISLFILWVIILLTFSASGFFTGLVVALCWLVYKKKYLSIALVLSGCVLGALIIHSHLKEFMWNNYRFWIWGELWKQFIQKPITGWGLGIMNVWKMTIENMQLRHAHSDYVQISTEAGLIGLGIVVWGIVDYVKRFIRMKKDDLTVRVALIFLGFLVLGFVNFPAHLWLIATMGMLGYSWLYTLENEVDNGIINTCRTA